jgi:hypothetical protein
MAAAAPVQQVRVKVVGLDRSGQVVTRQEAVLEAASGQSYELDGGSVRLPAGTYLIGAQVMTGSASDTLVVRQVRITRSETITMSAEHGRAVRVSLTGVTGTPDYVGITACLGTETAAETPVSASADRGQRLYAVPFRSRDVGFAYLATWNQAQVGPAQGPEYDISGSSGDGVPSRAAYQQRAGDLARLTMSVRSGVNPASSVMWQVGPDNYFQSLCTAGRTNGQQAAPFSTVHYVTPGVWTTEVDTEYLTHSGVTDFTGFSYLVRRLAARHSYVQTFGAAVAGPGAIQPSIEGNLFRFDATDLFDLPGLRGGDQCCARSVATLSRDGHRQWTARLNEWRGRSYLQKTLTTAGWYNFDVSAARWNPHGTEPADLLSTRATLDWHFYIRPVPPAGNEADFPVTVTTYEPRGLSVANQAGPGAATTVEFQVVRNGADGTAAPHYALKEVRVLASFNGGQTWHRLAISRSGRNWLAILRDPASGNVTLRSIVTDVKGDSRTETIYRAYAIGG